MFALHELIAIGAVALAAGFRLTLDVQRAFCVTHRQHASVRSIRRGRARITTMAIVTAYTGYLVR